MANRIPKEFKKRLWDDWVAGKSFKIALFKSTSNCNTEGVSTYAACLADGDEVSGTGYTAGGSAVVPAASAYVDTFNVSVDTTDLTWSTATLTGIRYAVLYETTIDIIVVVYDLLTDYSVTNGTFTAAINTGGLFKVK
ncbi:MAG: hypothetical protein WC998_03700 [Candidatus Paceibacterota bacterium]|jgi:hypothetical protein